MISRAKAGLALLLALTSGPALSAENTRKLVEMPAMMQDHMLANMRDHLVALEEILGHLAQGNTDDAGKVAEGRLGMSSLDLHGASHMAQFMPEAMAAAGTEMHRAASRFVLVAQDAELAPDGEARQAVFGALQAVTAACNACHQSFKIR